MTRSDVDKVTDALLQLNRQARYQRGPDGIAEYLTRQDFRGVRCESCACPVAEFMRRFDDRWYPDLMAGAARTGATA